MQLVSMRVPWTKLENMILHSSLLIGLLAVSTKDSAEIYDCSWLQFGYSKVDFRRTPNPEEDAS